MPSIKWGAPKFWYEVSWRAFATKSSVGPFLTQRVNPPVHQFAIPNPVMHLQYQYYVKAVNQLPGGKARFPRILIAILVMHF